MTPILPHTPNVPFGDQLGSNPLPHLERLPGLEANRGRYRMFFAKTQEEREAALRLRFEIFCQELGEGDPGAALTGLDVDSFDEQFQHLMVVDSIEHKVVGTYRMQTWEIAQTGEGLYTDLEFELPRLGLGFLKQSVELGRACVALEHRNKAVLYLLWQGLIQYMQFHGKTGFFGCSSLTSQDMAEGLRMFRQLTEEGHVHQELQTGPRPDWTCTAENSQGPTVKVPRLFRAYLRQGAKILAPPAIDRAFGTIDFLTYVFASETILRKYALTKE